MKLINKKIILLSGISLSTLIFCGYVLFDRKIPYSAETNYPIMYSSASFAKTYDNLEGMYKEAVIVAEVNVQEQRVKQDDSSAQTHSDVIITKLYKGEKNIKELTIAEIGGPLDLSKTSQLDKPGKGKEPYQGRIVEDTLEGSPTIKKGNKYIVFLRKNIDSNLYTILGSVQGKIKIESNEKLVSTVQSEYIENGNLFFLQKKYAGKDKVKLEEDINNVK
ncbi:MAG TPA: hypothetical protein DDY49_06435 [Paenibacillaceae bacterium]|nr:hypothetical protein [Paenibacillaceae bacterium]